MDEIKQVIFKIGGEEYGINVANVNAIEKYTNFRPVPNAPDFIDGLMDVRGEMIPVYNLRAKFKLPPAKVDDNTKMVVTTASGMDIAFQVDSVEEIIELEKKYISETPSIMKSPSTSYIDVVANVKGRMLIILNLNGILSEEEQELIKEMME